MEKKKPGVVFIICLIVLIAAVATIVVYQVKQHKNEKSYEDLAKEVTVEEDVSEEAPEVQEEPAPEIPIDFATLQAQNDDCYAWIRIADTQVDYPVMQSKEGEDEDYYLDHSFEREEVNTGALYTQYSYNPDPLEDPVTIIYGHNTKHGSMFGTLSEYADEEYRNAHSEILVYTPEHIYHYTAVFAITYDNRHLLDMYDCTTADGYSLLLSSIQTERLLPSWISDPFEVTTDDHLLILSTCKDGDNTKRFLVGAKLTQKE